MATANNSIRVINFGFGFTAEQRAELATLIGVTEGDLEITETKPQFDLSRQTVDDQVKALVEAANVPRGGAQRLIVNLPGMSWAAVAVLSAVQGFYGSLPEVMRLVQSEDKTFRVQEIVALQQLRDEGRRARYDGREGQQYEDDVVVVNFSHPLSAGQFFSHWKNPHVVDVPTQVDLNEKFEEVAVRLVDKAGLSSTQWQRTQNVIVNAPALAPLAAAVLTEIHARMGVYPRIMRLDRQQDASFKLVQTIDLQDLREWAHGFDAAKAEAARREALTGYLSVNPMGYLDQKTGELVLVAGGKTFRLQVSGVKVEEGVSYDAGSEITNRWLKSFDQAAKDQQLKFYPPGVGNGLIYAFMAEALQMGALSFASAPAVSPKPSTAE